MLCACMALVPNQHLNRACTVWNVLHNSFTKLVTREGFFPYLFRGGGREEGWGGEFDDRGQLSHGSDVTNFYIFETMSDEN